MRTGSAIASAPRARGFTYLWLLFVIAAGGAALAMLGEQWSTTLRRERERELLWRGRQIAEAIGSYRTAQGAQAPQWPRSFDDLLEDRRGAATRRHLRRVWCDPFTGAPDWVVLEAPEGEGWTGVRSRSQAPAMLVAELPQAARAASAPRVSDHVFMGQAAASAVTAASAVPPTAQKASGPGFSLGEWSGTSPPRAPPMGPE